LFTSPSWNILKAVGLGLANFPLPALGTFSDIMSYVRLMAVGLAGSVLASRFNELAASAGPILMVPILIFGHGLNVGLCLIALFAHGVRLNVLEFSNNFGLEWSGYPYHPFGREQLQEN
jgi:V/A-type H+-transporting ATPase subunit I